MHIPPAIVADEIAAMGGLVEETPPLAEPTVQDTPNHKTRRAKTYLRRMAGIVGFPSGVPVSLQRAVRAYLLQIAGHQANEDAWPKLEARLIASFPDQLCWLVGLPGAQVFAPFSETGELPGMSIGS